MIESKEAATIAMRRTSHLRVRRLLVGDWRPPDHSGWAKGTRALTTGTIHTA